jgi:F-type H+-transporting ATPase subunit epsilon
MSDIQCLVVTPEKTQIDVKSTSVTVPLFDGEMGILRGHSPMVGRLGYGVLRIQTGITTERYFVEEGLVQVNNNVVTILTEKVTPLSQITADAVRSASESAITMPREQPDQIAARQKAMIRAQALQRVTKS